ncbi:MAG: hypothetical protein MRY78_10515 [Saprospiraceae bacterium]|nr:hypothetical protein [Saprospiraceae bacterium]
MIILSILSLLFPRILIVVLYLFTDWFSGMFDSLLLPLLGFIITPISLLWYSIVHHYMGGEWNIVSITGMVVAIAIDLGSFRSYSRSRRKALI